MRAARALPLALLAWGGAAGAAEVRHRARVDDRDRVYVDVENAGRAAIVVTSLTVEFLDRGDRLLQRRSLDCRDDCAVAAGATESFGPIDAPRGWDGVRTSEVLYEGRDDGRRAPDDAGAVAAGDAAAPAPPAPRPARTPAPALDRSSREAVLRAFYVALNRGDAARARELYAGALPPADLEAWARRETRDQTVTEIRLLDVPGADRSPLGIEISFADSGKARRRVWLARDDTGWRVERVEPVP